MNDIYQTIDRKLVCNESKIISLGSNKFSATEIVLMALEDSFVECFRKIYKDGELEPGKPYIVQFGEDLDTIPFSSGLRANTAVVLQPVEKVEGNVQVYSGNVELKEDSNKED